MHMLCPGDPGGKRVPERVGNFRNLATAVRLTSGGACFGAATRRLAASRHNAVDRFVGTHGAMEAVDDFIYGNGSDH